MIYLVFCHRLLGGWLLVEVFQGLRHEALVLAEVPASLAKQTVPHFGRAYCLRPEFSGLVHVCAPAFGVFVAKSTNCFDNFAV